MTSVAQNHQTIPSVSTKIKGNIYQLGYTSDEQKRLIKQHEVWTKSLDYLIHPSVARTLPPNAEIADIATGTGIWLKDVAAISPSTYRFHGLDISHDTLLPASNFPSNVSFGKLDILKPIPENLRGKFDLVNVRLIMLIMGDESVWKATLKHLISLVKPGGMLQWSEGCFEELRAVRGGLQDSSAGEVVREIMERSQCAKGSSLDIKLAELGKWFKEEGLVDVKEDIVASDRNPETRIGFSQSALVAIFTIWKAKIQMGYMEETLSAEEMKEKEEEARREIEGGVYIKFDIQLAVGRKKA